MSMHCIINLTPALTAPQNTAFASPLGSAHYTVSHAAGTEMCFCIRRPDAACLKVDAGVAHDG